MLQQKKLAIAVSVAIGASMAAMSTAQAFETLFFPHIVKSPTVATIVSVINTGNDTAVSELHYSLFYKDITDGNAATLRDPCFEYNVPLPTSAKDIQTFDISGYFGQPDDLGVLFNDPSIKNNWRKANENFALAMNTFDAARGFLLVDDQDRFAAGSTGLAGEAFVFEYNEGAAWGYQAWSRSGQDAPAGAENMNSADAFNYAGASTPFAQNFVPVLPLDEFATGFMVTPLAPAAVAGSGQFNGNLAAVLQLRGLPPTADLYDRDEVPVSGRVPQRVVCVGRVDIQDLLPVASRARLVDGGWGSLVLGNTSGAENLAVVYKLEYNLGNIFNGEDIGGLYNNAFQYNNQRNR